MSGIPICEKVVALKRCNGCLQMICENCISPESIGVNHEGFCLQCTILPEQEPFQCSIMINKRCLKCKSIKHQKQCISCENRVKSVFDKLFLHQFSTKIHQTLRDGVKIKRSKGKVQNKKK